MFQHALLNELIAFVTVSDLGSFTKAAERLGVSKSAVGKAIKKLEDSQNVKLFNRNTRSVSLTEEGKVLVDASKIALAAIENAKSQISSRQKTPIGKIKVNLPVGFSQFVLSQLPIFYKQNPHVTIDLTFDDKFVDVIGENWDIVVRIGALQDSNLLGKHLDTLRYVICATPEYLSRFGVPENANDLSLHQTISFQMSSGRIRPWKLLIDEEEIEFTLSSRLTFTDGRSQIDAALSHLGLLQIYDRSVCEHLRDGSLVEILPDVSVAGPSVTALVGSGRVMPAKTRAFLNFLQQIFSHHIPPN